MGQKIRESDILIEGRLSYSKMYQLIKDWTRDMRESGPTPTMTDNLDLAHNWLGALTAENDYLQDQGASITFAAAAGEALSQSLYVLSNSNTKTKGLNWSWVLDATTYPEQMIARGWCAVQVDYLISIGIGAFGHAFAMQPPIEDHPDCTYSNCVFNSIDPSAYQRRHTEKDCGCENLKPDVTAISGLLRINKIPVITPQLDIMDSQGKEYIVISHVWRHGIGSAAERGLPKCQIYRIIGLVSSLIPNANFWIDSLCVPDEQDTRTRAIGLMAQTYQEASAVVVFDKVIRKLSAQDSLHAILMAINISDWMHRLWTLQEAILGRQVFFESRDGFISLDELISKVFESELDFLSERLCTQIFRLADEFSQGGYQLAEVSMLLQWRKSSRQTDETLAIARLLNADVLALARAAPAERMKMLLLELQDLHSSIIFFPSPKMDIGCFRWAPQSFMIGSSRRAGGGYQMGDETDARCTKVGLEASYHALVSPKLLSFRSSLQLFVRQAQSGAIFCVVPKIQDGGLNAAATFNMILFRESDTARLDILNRKAYCAGVWCDLEAAERDWSTPSPRIRCDYRVCLSFFQILKEDAKSQIERDAIANALA